jgi:hypothetical protein
MPMSFYLQELASIEARVSRPTNLPIDARTLTLVPAWRCSRKNQHINSRYDARSQGRAAPDTSQDAGRIRDEVPSC